MSFNAFLDVVKNALVIRSCPAKFNKEIKNGRWRAYSKGTIELCEKYSAFAVKARSTLVDAPKDVRRLEALKPPNVPSMGERYDAGVAKEKRLEAATQPIMASSVKANGNATKGVEEEEEDIMNFKRKRKNNQEEDDSGSGEDEPEEDVAASKMRKKKRHQAKKNKAAVVNESDLNNVAALKEEDMVQEGIVWSDSESE